MSPNPSGPSSTPSTPSMPSAVRPLRDLPSIPPSARVQAPPKPQDPFLSIMRSLKPESIPKTTVPLGAADTNSGTPLATPNPRPPTANSSTVGSTSSGEDFPKIKCNIGGTPCRPVGVLDDGTPVPGEWLEFMHLDGSVYYYQPSRRFITPENIRNHAVMTAFMNAWSKYEAENQVLINKYYNDDNCDVVFDGLFDKSGPKAYFLNCRSGYYVEVVHKEPRPSGTGEAGATYEISVEEKTERYWQTLETFPMHLVRVPYRAEAEFLGALSYGASERVLEWSKTSFPFSDQQAQRLLQVYFDLKNGAKQDPEIIPTLVWHIARTMAVIEGSRARAKHGTDQAQIYRQVAVAPSSWSMRLTDIFLACVLFGVQKMYRVRLEGERVGGVIYTPDMRELFQHFLAEWSDTNLLATVFVGGNIGFLAVPGINGLQRTASLASSLFAIMSIITGLHHVWQHRSGVDASAEEVRGYLYRFHTLGKENDLAALACFLSLPVVALIWSLLSFSVALGAFCIQGTGLHGRRLLAAMLILLGVLSIATILFFWHIWRGPHREEISDENVDEVIADGWAHSIRRVRTDLKKVFRRPKRGNAAHELTTRSEA